MFTREKHCKNSQNISHPPILISSNKYHQKAHQKTKKQANKKNKCDRLWKKKSSYIYWSEKENDKNSSNYNIPKKHYDNKKKFFKYQKKLSKSELIFNSCFSSENNNYENKNIYSYKEEVSKDDKSNSFEYVTTLAHSNSISTHEESNNNIININTNENQNNKIDENDLTNANKFYQIFDQQNVFSKNSDDIIINQNKILDKENDLNLNEQIFSNSMKNLNFIKLNSCPNFLCEFSSLSSSQVSKIQNMSKYSEINSSEPYNKYNSINQDLNQLWINPIAENTEVLNVNVKISENKSAVFKLRRFDDLFLTVKLFCEINSIDEKLMKPIIIKALCALNNIYQVINAKLDDKLIKKLKMLNTFVNNTYI
jgi:hypothetical protein